MPEIRFRIPLTAWEMLREERPKMVWETFEQMIADRMGRERFQIEKARISPLWSPITRATRLMKAAFEHHEFHAKMEYPTQIINQIGIILYLDDDELVWFRLKYL